MKNLDPRIKKILLIVIPVIVCILIYVISIAVYKFEKSYKKKVKEEEERAAYLAANEKLYNLDEYPKVDASVLVQPLATAFLKNFTGEEELNEEEIEYTNTHTAYEKLINDEVDLIIATEPSKDERILAKEKGVELELIPVVKEGFVFYVNSENKVNNLSLDQIRNIYTGDITNWKLVGGSKEDIIAYQRLKNSESQKAMISLVMNDLNMMQPPKENLIDTGYEIKNLVASFNNDKNGIGYSYYQYAKTMFKTQKEEISGNIKLLSINGIEPNYETIQQELYPLETAYYIVINKADRETEASRLLMEKMLSERGQRVAGEAGYIPAK